MLRRFLSTVFSRLYSVPISRLLKSVLLASIVLVPTCFVPMVSTSYPSNHSTPEKYGQVVNGVSEQTDGVRSVTLLTGDLVSVMATPEGTSVLSIQPADPKSLYQTFQILRAGNDTYVIPSSVDLRKVDREFFNVDRLLRDGYYNETSTPVIVKCKDIKDVEDVMTAAKAKVTFKSTRSACVAGMVPKQKTRELLGALAKSSSVHKIWLDRKVKVDLGQSVPLIGAPYLWGLGINGSGMQIAILDTGIDWNHPCLDDLDDNPATVDPKVIVKKSFVTYPDPDPMDYYGHGTHCAGIAAATGQDVGGLAVGPGVAPSAWLWDVKVLNQEGWGYDSWCIAGIEFAAYGPDGVSSTGDEADVLSMSWGAAWWSDGTDPVSAAVDAAVDAGRVCAVAAGNYGEYFTIGVPATARKAITVGASTKYDGLAWFSSCGPTADFRVKPDVLAPGADILSSVPWGAESWSGTSMATPHVAGAAALLKQLYGWTPSFIKDALIDSANDLGYDIYGQGGGRINLTWAASVPLLIDPATLSFGPIGSALYVSEPFTIHNLGSAALEVSLSVEVTDLYGTSWNCATPNASTIIIGPHSCRDVLLSVDGSAVPSGVYGGRMTADFDGGSVHAIFGFAKANIVTVTTLGLDGNPDPLRWVTAFKKDVSSWDDFAINYREVSTGENGETQLWLFDGDYYITSPRVYGNGVDVWTIAESHVGSDMIVTLDDRGTNVVEFDPNKTDQIVCSKLSMLNYIQVEPYSLSWGTAILCYYPLTTSSKMSSTSLNVTFGYIYYPESDFKVAFPNLIDTREWHNFLYAEKGIGGAIQYVAGYGDSVKKSTIYKTAMTPKVGADFAQWSFTQLFPQSWATSFVWRMTLPQSRIEYLSPYTHYSADLWKGSDRPGVSTPYWDYYSGEDYWQVHDPGSTLYESWISHPLIAYFRNTAWIYDTSASVGFLGYFFQDSYGHHFSNPSRWPAGLIRVFRNETLIGEGYESDWFWWDFSDEPVPSAYRVMLDGWSGQYLSTQSHVELNFTVGQGIFDYSPPLIHFRIPSLDSNNTHPPGDVAGSVVAEDESPLTDLTLEYSINEGLTWTIVSLSPPLTNAAFTLTDLSNVYVSLRANATDTQGNRISQTTIRGFYVSVPTLLSLEDFPHPFILSDGAVSTMIVVGASNARGPCNPAHTIDVAAAIYEAFALGTRAESDMPEVWLDWQVTNFNATHVIRVFKPGNIITLGGLGVNLVSWYYHSLTYMGIQTLPAYFASDGQGVYIYSTATHHQYYMVNEYGQGLPVTDYAMIVLHYDPTDSRYVLLVAGLSGYSTYEAAKWLSGYPTMSGNAIVLRMTDNEGDGVIDNITAAE